ncbi:hypothetical protein [Paracoccus sp. ME4]|uniref:FliH/SctL family protein n=1 Tax=Paracoccus sp. ME4 TaxID=3138066 RepID=UPI00398AA0EB
MNLFTRNFDEEGRKAALAADAARLAAPGHVLTDAELRVRLEEARAEGRRVGHAEGLDAGRAEALAGAEARACEAMGPLTAALTELSGARDEYRAAVLRDMGGFLKGVADRLLPHVEALVGQDHLMAEIDRISRHALGAERIRIRVSPEIMPAVRRRILASLDFDEERMSRFTLTADDALGPLDVTAQWPSGGSEYSFRRLTNAIKDMIDDIASAPIADR